MTDSSVSDWIKNSGFNPTFVMGFGPLDYVSDLLKQSSEGSSVFDVNYELWTILIYFSLVLLDAPDYISEHITENRFVRAVHVGSQYSLGINNKGKIDYYSKTCENGLFIYYRLLLSTNVLLTGHGYHVDLMSNWNNFDIHVLAQFFDLFENLMTTNYDLLLEKITNRRIFHLHGNFQSNSQVIFGQSLGVFVNAMRYDLSSVLIGDYFITKSFYATVVALAEKHSLVKTDTHHEIMKRIIKEQKSDTIVIFGLNANNDFHLIRNLQVFLFQSGLDHANVIFCYYSQQDKETFKNAYETCITYSDELNCYVHNHISTYTIDSHCLLQKYFVSPKGCVQTSKRV